MSGGGAEQDGGVGVSAGTGRSVHLKAGLQRSLSHAPLKRSENTHLPG